MAQTSKQVPEMILHSDNIAGEDSGGNNLQPAINGETYDPGSPTSPTNHMPKNVLPTANELKINRSLSSTHENHPFTNGPVSSHCVCSGNKPCNTCVKSTFPNDTAQHVRKNVTKDSDKAYPMLLDTNDESQEHGSRNRTHSDSDLFIFKPANRSKRSYSSCGSEPPRSFDSDELTAAFVSCMSHNIENTIDRVYNLEGHSSEQENETKSTEHGIESDGTEQTLKDNMQFDTAADKSESKLSIKSFTSKQSAMVNNTNLLSGPSSIEFPRTCFQSTDSNSYPIISSVTSTVALPSSSQAVGSLVSIAPTTSPPISSLQSVFTENNQNITCNKPSKSVPAHIKPLFGPTNPTHLTALLASKPVEIAAAWPTVMDSTDMCVRSVNTPLHYVTVPFGWQRLVEDNSVIYYSPSNTRLVSGTQVKQYLLTAGTCKCGLECPVNVDRLFNFDPTVQSKPWKLDTVNCNEDLTKLCNHKRKIIAMATLQSTAGMHRNHEPVKKRKVKEAVGKKRKARRLKGSNYDGVKVSELLAQRDKKSTKQQKATPNTDIPPGQGFPNLAMSPHQTFPSSQLAGIPGSNRLQSPVMVSPPGVNMLHSPGMVSPPGANMMLSHGMVSPSGANMLQHPGMVSPPGANMLHNPAMVSPPGAGRLQSPGVVSPPGVNRLNSPGMMQPQYTTHIPPNQQQTPMMQFPNMRGPPAMFRYPSQPQDFPDQMQGVRGPYHPMMNQQQQGFMGMPQRFQPHGFMPAGNPNMNFLRMQGMNGPVGPQQGHVFMQPMMNGPPNPMFMPQNFPAGSGMPGVTPMQGYYDHKWLEPKARKKRPRKKKKVETESDGREATPTAGLRNGTEGESLENKPSFLDNPTQFMAQQTALLNSKLSQESKISEQAENNCESAAPVSKLSVNSNVASSKNSDKSIGTSTSDTHESASCDVNTSVSESGVMDTVVLPTSSPPLHQASSSINNDTVIVSKSSPSISSSPTAPSHASSKSSSPPSHESVTEQPSLELPASSQSRSEEQSTTYSSITASATPTHFIHQQSPSIHLVSGQGPSGASIPLQSSPSQMGPGGYHQTLPGQQSVSITQSVAPLNKVSSSISYSHALGFHYNNNNNSGSALGLQHPNATSFPASTLLSAAAKAQHTSTNLHQQQLILSQTAPANYVNHLVQGQIHPGQGHMNIGPNHINLGQGQMSLGQGQMSFGQGDSNMISVFPGKLDVFSNQPSVAPSFFTNTVNSSVSVQPSFPASFSNASAVLTRPSVSTTSTNSNKEQSPIQAVQNMVSGLEAAEHAINAALARQQQTAPKPRGRRADNGNKVLGKPNRSMDNTTGNMIPQGMVQPPPGVPMLLQQQYPLAAGNQGGCLPQINMPVVTTVTNSLSQVIPSAGPNQHMQQQPVMQIVNAVAMNPVQNTLVIQPMMGMPPSGQVMNHISVQQCNNELQSQMNVGNTGLVSMAGPSRGQAVNYDVVNNTLIPQVNNSVMVKNVNEPSILMSPHTSSSSSSGLSTDNIVAKNVSAILENAERQQVALAMSETEKKPRKKRERKKAQKPTIASMLQAQHPQIIMVPPGRQQQQQQPSAPGQQQVMFLPGGLQQTSLQGNFHDPSHSFLPPHSIAPVAGVPVGGLPAPMIQMLQLQQQQQHLLQQAQTLENLQHQVAQQLLQNSALQAKQSPEKIRQVHAVDQQAMTEVVNAPVMGKQIYQGQSIQPANSIPTSTKNMLLEERRQSNDNHSSAHSEEMDNRLPSAGPNTQEVWTSSGHSGDNIVSESTVNPRQTYDDSVHSCINQEVKESVNCSQSKMESYSMKESVSEEPSVDSQAFVDDDPEGAHDEARTPSDHLDDHAGEKEVETWTREPTAIDEESEVHQGTKRPLQNEVDERFESVDRWRSFSTGDLVWGQLRGYQSWPGQLVDEMDIRANHKSEEGKLWVRWFGNHSVSQVEPENLKTLDEGLDEHHTARKKLRKGRKMNSNLESAIQEAMNELDRRMDAKELIQLDIGNKRQKLC